MGKNKKKFVEKDKSTKFVLLHRSQQDAEYGKEGASEFVLYPMDGQKERSQGPETTSKAPLKASKDHVNSLGFVNDGYDYEQHLLTITEGAQFMSASGVLTKAVIPAEAMASTEDEKERHLDAVTLTEDCMDPDMRAALFNPNNFDSWDLNDDFVEQAIKEDDENDNADDNHDGFDYEAHIAKMLKASENAIASSDANNEKITDGIRDEDDSDCEYDSDLDTLDMMGSCQDQAQKMIEIEFEKTLGEYDSDECGELEDPEYDESMQGQLTLDNEDVSKLMDEFLVIHERDRKFHSQTKAEAVDHKNREISKLLSDKGNDDDEEEEEGGEEEEEDSGDEDYMPEYFKPREISEFDCESIVSTYSNIENHPMKIKPERSSRKKKSSTSSSTSDDASSVSSSSSRLSKYGPKVITISAKTGLPVIQESHKMKSNNMNDDDDDENNNMKNNKGMARNKKETKEEKRLRKQQIKDERKNNRDIKRKLKTAYKEDDMLQQKVSNSNSGVPVFKY